MSAQSYDCCTKIIKFFDRKVAVKVVRLSSQQLQWIRTEKICSSLFHRLLCLHEPTDSCFTAAHSQMFGNQLTADIQSQSCRCSAGALHLALLTGTSFFYHRFDWLLINRSWTNEHSQNYRVQCSYCHTEMRGTEVKPLRCLWATSEAAGERLRGPQVRLWFNGAVCSINLYRLNTRL